VLPGFCRAPLHSEQMADTPATAGCAIVSAEALVLRGFAEGIVLLPQHFTAGTFVAGINANETTDRHESLSRRVAIPFRFAIGVGEHRGLTV
jgi:hypothetical protein